MNTQRETCHNTQNSNTAVAGALLTVYFVLSFYTFGALVIENDVNYNTWITIGDAEFPAYHRRLQQLLIPVFMVPLGLQLLVSILLLIVRPLIISRRVIVSFIILNVYVLGESSLVQVPIHNALNLEKNSELLGELISTHQSLRLPAEILLFVLNVIQLYKVIGRCYATRS